MSTYDFPPDPWLAPAAGRTCGRCGHVLVGEDECGMYYQAAITDPDTGLIFMDRVHACEGKPHQLPAASAVTEIREACPDCGAVIDEPHDDACDVARCLATGMQRLLCSGDEHCGQDIWSGLWPGEAECAEYGWWAYFEGGPAGETGTGWVRCGPDHPDAVPDLNRLILDCRWDQVRGRWVRKP